MEFSIVLIAMAALFIGAELWGRHHPPDHPRYFRPSVEDSTFNDRFMIIDSGGSIPAVGAYLQFVSESGSQGGLIHNYINRGLHELNKALLGVSGLDLRVGTVDRMQIAYSDYVDSLAAHPRWALYPDRVRPAMLMAVEIMGALNLPYDDETRKRLDNAKQAAEALEGGRITLWQRGKVQDFFIQCGYALVKLEERAFLQSPMEKVPKIRPN